MKIYMLLFRCLVVFLLLYLCQGAWLPYTHWSTCTATCGFGQITRTRICNGTCQGSPVQQKSCVSSCRLDTCPGWFKYLLIY